MKALRWIAYGGAGIVLLALLFAAWVWIASAREIGRSRDAAPERLARPSAAQLADAPRQARILGCFGCHGEGLRGQVTLDIPHVVKLWSPNLTAIAARADDQQLAQAIRQGIGVDGRALWQMPSPGYSWLTDSDVAALIAVIRAQPRGGAASPPASFGPLGRFAVATGRLRSAPARLADFRARPPQDVGPEHSAGRHIAMVNCGDCHASDLSGREMESGDVAPDLAIAAGYDADQFRTLIRTGQAPHGRDLGLMARVARRDFSVMTDAEIARLYDYLQALAQRSAE